MLFCKKYTYKLELFNKDSYLIKYNYLIRYLYIDNKKCLFLQYNYRMFESNIKLKIYCFIQLQNFNNQKHDDRFKL